MVDFGTPDIIDSCLTDRFLSYMICDNNIFIGLLFPDIKKIIREVFEMGFLRSTKGSIVSDYFFLQEDIAGFSKGNAYDVALYKDHLEVTSLQKKKLLLNYDQITDVFYGYETELIKKSKSVIGRALVGGVIFGGLGAVVGAVSGTGEKTEKKMHLYLIISYTDSDGNDNFMQFEDTRHYKGKKIYKKLKDLAHIESESIPDVQNL